MLVWIEEVSAYSARARRGAAGRRLDELRPHADAGHLARVQPAGAADAPSRHLARREGPARHRHVLDPLGDLVGGVHRRRGALRHALPGREGGRPRQPHRVRDAVAHRRLDDSRYDGEDPGAPTCIRPSRPTASPARCSRALRISTTSRRRWFASSSRSDRGKPSEHGNLKWERRHAPIVSIRTVGPCCAWRRPSNPRRPLPNPRRPTPDPRRPLPTCRSEPPSASGYRPTFYWLDGAALKFSRLDGPDWSPIRSIAIDDTMTYEKARDLVVAMGQRN